LLQRILLFLAGILAVVLVVALIAGGEDDGEEMTGTTTGKTAATTGKGAAASTPGETECQEKGISAPPHEEGACVDGGIRYVVVNRDGVLKLPTLEAEMLDLRGTKTITGESGGSATTKGVYAIVELSITNRTDIPERFEDSQIVLWVGGPYTADAKVQSKVERKSFLGQDTPIQPGDSQVGTVVFDLTSTGFKALDTKGNLDIVNFGSKGEVLTQDEIGTIRTYQ
jgi:hypothetical protein